MEEEDQNEEDVEQDVEEDLEEHVEKDLKALHEEPAREGGAQGESREANVAVQAEEN